MSARLTEDGAAVRRRPCNECPFTQADAETDSEICAWFKSPTTEQDTRFPCHMDEGLDHEFVEGCAGWYRRAKRLGVFV